MFPLSDLPAKSTPGAGCPNFRARRADEVIE